MSDQPPATNPTAPVPSESPILIQEEMQESYLTYAMSVIVSRALPDARDGFKPSQRRILVAMNDLNLQPNRKHIKCAKITGQTSGDYHPHGDQVIYPTLVRLGQWWTTRYTMVDPQGNFGSIDDDPPAAQRYTEARMTAAAAAMLEDIEEDVVDFVPNYDNRLEEPTVLPSKFPNLLVNGSQGIAVGMATSIPPHNLGEVCNALLAIIEDPGLPLDRLLQIIPGPDFPTAGKIVGRAGIVQACRTGRGQIVVRSHIELEELRNGRLQLVATDIPYGQKKDAIVLKIAEAIKAGQLDGVASVNDESDRKTPVRIVIDLKRDAVTDVVINQLYKHTPLQVSFSIINIALVNGRPETLTIRQMLDLYLEHRAEVIRRRTRHRLTKALQRAHIVEGLLLAISDIDRIIETIKRSADRADARVNLMALQLRLIEQDTLKRLLPEEFQREARTTGRQLSGPQADAILAMTLGALAGLEVEKLAREYGELQERINDYQGILASHARVLAIISDDLRWLLERFADKRRTQIEDAESDIAIEDLIPREQVAVTVSHEGYIKRVQLAEYRSQGRGGQGVRGADFKEGDFTEHLFVSSTHDYLLIFTNLGRVYWKKVYDIPEAGRTARGRALANLLQMQAGERMQALLTVSDFEREEQCIVFATRKGTVKKTELKAFSNPRSAGIIAINLDEGDELIGAALCQGGDEIVLCSREGMAIRFDEDKVRSMGRNATGVRGMDMAENDSVVSMLVVRDESTTVLTVCEKGFGKRTAIREYRKTNRGGKGVINIKTTSRNGKVATVLPVIDSDELMIISEKGIIMRTGLGELRTMGRATQGVTIMKLKSDDDRVVSVARVPVEEAQG